MSRRPKYGNVRTELDGEKFDSKGEAQWFAGLKLLVKAGEITHLERQVRYPLVVYHINTGTYVADAAWVDKAGKQHVADFKGMDTPVSKLKRKLVAALYGIDVEIVKAVRR